MDGWVDGGSAGNEWQDVCHVINPWHKWFHQWELSICKLCVFPFVSFIFFYPPILGKHSTYYPLIVCSNDPIFFKWPLISGKQCYRIEFLFSLHDFFSNSKVPKMGFFKNLPNICRKIVPKLFKKILDHILCTDNQMVACEKLSIHLL